MRTEQHDAAPPPPPPAAPRRRGLLLAVVLVITGLFGALLAFGLLRDPTNVGSPLIGRPAPPFSLPGLDGGRVSLAGLRGQVVVVNFWASWCRPCREEHPHLLRAWQRFRESGVTIVGVVYQDTESEVRRYVEELGGDWPVAMDPGSRTALAYGVYRIPETYFIAPDGTVAYKHIGAVSYEILDDRITELLERA